jgi:hypothetical protein
MEMKQFINCVQAIFLIFLLNACGTPLHDYNPKNEKEKEIKSLLVQFTEYRNNYDVNNMAACLADICIINFYGVSLKKASFVSRMKRGDLESIGKFKFTDPKFNIVDEIAQVSIRFRQGLTAFTVNFKMIHENSGWKISKWDEHFH